MKTTYFIHGFLCLMFISCQTTDTVYNEPVDIQTSEIKSPSEIKGGEVSSIDEKAYKNTSEQSHEIHWYAIENKDNEAYWAGVNCSKIWVEYKLGVDPYGVEIQDFLQKFSLLESDRKSPRPDRTNYVIYDLFDGTKEQVLEIVYYAQNLEFILFVEPQSSYVQNFVPNDTFWDQQWGPYVIYSDEAWNVSTGNSLNVIAVIDDACDYLHEDLFDQVQYGWDYGFNDEDPAPDFTDQVHGTHVTGAIAASINNGTGIAGMVNDTIFFAKVTDGTYDPEVGNFSDAAIVDALYDIADVPRIGVINMSLGGPTPSAALENACNTAWNAGKILVAASGNDGTNLISFPAAFESCIAVGAIGTDGGGLYLSDYSQFGNEQEVVAPGGDLATGFGILSTLPNNDYGFLQGTSMATPHVAGLVGLMLSMNSGLSNNQLRTLLQESCVDLGDAGWDPVFGFGMVNAVNALNLIENGGVGIEEEEELQWSVYPNPTRDFLKIKFQSMPNANQLSLRSLDGSIVKEEWVADANNEFYWDLDGIASGVYILSVSDRQRLLQHKKIIINQ